MSTKTLVWILLFIGSGIGGSIPLLWGDSFFSITSILGSAIGGILGVFAGIWLGNRINN